MCVIIPVFRSHQHIDWPQGFLHLLLIGAGSEAGFTLLMVPMPPLPIGNRIGGEQKRSAVHVDLLTIWLQSVVNILYGQQIGIKLWLV